MITNCGTAVPRKGPFTPISKPRLLRPSTSAFIWTRPTLPVPGPTNTSIGTPSAAPRTVAITNGGNRHQTPRPPTELPSGDGFPLRGQHLQASANGIFDTGGIQSAGPQHIGMAGVLDECIRQTKIQHRHHQSFTGQEFVDG
jgi:hypothetical protein